MRKIEQKKALRINGTISILLAIQLILASITKRNELRPGLVKFVLVATHNEEKLAVRFRKCSEVKERVEKE